MRRLALASLLAVAACQEPSAVKRPPTDRFILPSALGLMTRADGGSALLVASGNYGLAYDGAAGGTLLSVDPAQAPTGSAGQAGGALVRLGHGAHVGSFAGQLAVVDEANCPGLGRPPEVLLTTRYAEQVWRLPLGLDGTLGPCQGLGCILASSQLVRDPFGLAVACRADGARRSAFVGYLVAAAANGAGSAGWLSEFDLDHPEAPARIFGVGGSPLAGLSFDARTDRLYALAQEHLAAPVMILDLQRCPASEAGCPTAKYVRVDLYPQIPGLDLQAMAFANDQSGLRRRAYLTARVYDDNLARLYGGRPSTDLAGVLLVLDLEEGPTGRPTLRIDRIVPIGVGPSQLRVLPQRTPGLLGPRRDVVVTSSGDGDVRIYDDEEGVVARVIALDLATGAPVVGREPFGLAVEPRTSPSPAGPVARVYVASVKDSVVSLIDVPLDAPGEAHEPRDAAGAPLRIGGLQ